MHLFTHLTLLHIYLYSFSFFLFFFNAPSTTEIYTLSLHDALPISVRTRRAGRKGCVEVELKSGIEHEVADLDRKSTRLNSSHVSISYAVFCLKKKKKKKKKKRI